MVTFRASAVSMVPTADVEQPAAGGVVSDQGREAAQAHPVVPVGGRRALVRWVSPTRGYVVAVVVTAVLAAAGIGWWQLRLVTGTGGASGGLGFAVASVVVALAGAVVMVETARRPQPWVPGMSRREQPPRLRDPVERRVVRRAMWHGELPVERRLQRAAAIRMATPVANRSFLGLLFLPPAVQLGLLTSTEIGPVDRWAWAIAGTVPVLVLGAALVTVAWLRRQTHALERAFERQDPQREPAR